MIFVVIRDRGTGQTLMALLTFLFLSLSTEHVVFLCVTCPCSFWTKCHANLFVYYLLLHVMKLLKYKSTIGQEQSMPLHSARQTLCSQVAALFCVK